MAPATTATPAMAVVAALFPLKVVRGAEVELRWMRENADLDMMALT